MKTEDLFGDMAFFLKLGDAMSKPSCIQCTDDMTIPVLAACVVIGTIFWAAAEG